MVAALAGWHESHEVAAAAVQDVTRLPAHALLEAYAVLTRFPGGNAVPAGAAAAVLAERFPGEPLRLDDAGARGLVGTLAAAQVFGGASYDALVGLEARGHDQTLLTLDRRAQETYRRLDVAFTVVPTAGG